ncbi:MAG: hypothetical protein JNM72_11005 [Deltaproteobacteria bacterium]|nr:hypothetical protein [Deltaproteobacteria bacterium]
MPTPPLALLTLLAAIPDPGPYAAAVTSDAGWVEVGRRTEDGIGEVILKHKKVGEVDCLQGLATVPEAPSALLAVAADVPSATKWSRWELVASKVISKGGGAVNYVQLLDNPAPIADRYWFLEGRSLPGEEQARFTWRHIDPEAHPAVLAEIKNLRSSAVSTVVNVGEWRFTKGAAGTELRYRICTDAGGAIPRWAGEFAATRTLPSNLADLVLEARRRASR